MTRFHKFFAASLLTLVASTSVLAGEMDFPVASCAGEMDFPVASATAPTSVDPATELMIFVLENLLQVF